MKLSWSPSSIFPTCLPEYVAVILASSTGSRLFPLTSSSEMPKHMLPICGIPVISRLLRTVYASGFRECVIVLAHDDKVTIPHLKQELLANDETNNNKASNAKSQQQQQDSLAGSYQITSNQPSCLVLESSASSFDAASATMKITVISLREGCPGSIQALRQVEEAGVVPEPSNMMVLPGDLVVFDTSVLRNLCDTHRQGRQQSTSNQSSKNTACTVLLTDVGEQDEHGVPLKESAKAKKGGLARDEEDIEYIALSYTSSSSLPSAPRLVWKELKIDVHDNTAMLAETPKLSLPKPRLRVCGVTRVRTDWNDVHVYILSPWVRRLVVSRKSLMTIQGDLLPLLISRQFQGITATFGSHVEPEVVQEVLLNSPDLVKRDLAGPLTDGDNLRPRRGSPISRPSFSKRDKKMMEKNEYDVLAHVQDEAVRTHTIASYLHASRELLTRASAGDHATDKNPCLKLPLNTSVKSKFHSILLPGATAGDKVTFKSASVGRDCKLGAKCRLNNVIIMDGSSIGDNVILQNSIVGPNCSIGDNCNLNDCQVAPGKDISSGEKAKGESFS